MPIDTLRLKIATKDFVRAEINGVRTGIGKLKSSTIRRFVGTGLSVAAPGLTGVGLMIRYLPR